MRFSLLIIALLLCNSTAFTQIISNEEAEEGLRELFPTSLNLKVDLISEVDELGETGKQFLEKLVSWGYITVEPIAGRKISVLPVKSKISPYLVSLTGSSSEDGAVFLASSMLILEEVLEVRRSENEGNFSVTTNCSLYSMSPIGKAIGLEEGRSLELKFELTETSNGWRLSSAAEKNQFFTPITASAWGTNELGKKEIMDGLPGSIIGTWSRDAGLVKKTKESWTFREDSTFSFYEEMKDELTEGKFLIQEKSIRIIPERGRRYNLYFCPKGTAGNIGIGMNDKMFDEFENEAANLANASAQAQTLTEIRNLFIGTWSDENGRYRWEIGEEQATIEIKEKREIVTLTGPWKPIMSGPWVYLVMNPGTPEEQQINIVKKYEDFLRDEYFSYKFQSFYKE